MTAITTKSLPLNAMRWTAAALGAAVSAPALAAGLTVGVEVPRLEVAEYHRPYVAVWLERADNSVAATLSVWYDTKMRNGDGTKWLKDLRQWWRRAGRDLSMPIDGVTSPTRPVGQHKLEFTAGSGPLPTLPAGEYRIMVEAAREVGGRELVSVPFTWPPAPNAQLTAKGKTELGTITLELRP